jgi:hypothetical protein
MEEKIFLSAREAVLPAFLREVREGIFLRKILPKRIVFMESCSEIRALKRVENSLACWLSANIRLALVWILPRLHGISDLRKKNIQEGDESGR